MGEGGRKRHLSCGQQMVFNRCLYLSSSSHHWRTQGRAPHPVSFIFTQFSVKNLTK